MFIADNAPSLLTEFETTYVKASAGKRFANLLIDSGMFNVVSWLFEMTVGPLMPTFVSFKTSSFSLLWDFFVSICLFVVFISIQEAALHGKTIGKFITGTKAINVDGTPMSGYTPFIRALTRLVPFEPFSAFGSPPNPWHDKWTKTMVIDEKQTAESSIDINT